MLDSVLNKLGDGQFIALLFAALGCAATILVVIVPLLQTDNLSRRIKAVGCTAIADRNSALLAATMIFVSSGRP